jgi:Uma2 family endonuclease
MGTALALGPADHGRPLTPEEFTAARWQGGYCYELIHGRLYVLPAPGLPHDLLVQWLYRKLDGYSSRRPAVINYVSSRPRVFVHGVPEATRPEPDVAAFHDFPLHLPIGSYDWRDVSPVLVAEVVSEDDPDKDLVRNVGLYVLVPSIREYWVLDPRPDPNRPTLLVYRRRGRRWQAVRTVAPGGVYTTPLLPGFTLTVDPHR